MNVAVPSDQQSLRLGQPASSHTVTRPKSRTVFFSDSTSGPCTTFGRSQSGLRVAIVSPSETPAWPSLAIIRPVSFSGAVPAMPWSAAVRTAVPGPSPRENALRSSGRCFQATSWRSSAPPPQTSAACRASTSTTSRIVISRPVPSRMPANSSASEVTGLSAMPHGTMCSRMNARSVVTFNAKPCIVRPRERRTPIAQILRGFGPSASIHTPGYSASTPAVVSPNSWRVRTTTCCTAATWSLAPRELATDTIG